MTIVMAQGLFIIRTTEGTEGCQRGNEINQTTAIAMKEKKLERHNT